MKTILDIRSHKRSIKRLFGAKSRPSPHKRLPNEYFKNVWLTKKMHTGVEIIAKIERMSNKAATNMLVESGISRYLAELLKRHAENEVANRERVDGTDVIVTAQGIKVLRKYLAEHGLSEYRSKKGGL
ncbi:hypothetical protein ACFLVQ_00305 [Chloroflexota bacterium]